MPDPYGFVEADVTVGTDKYCMFFQGPGDGNKFLSKDQLAGSCGVCGDGVKDELEDCDGSDAEYCPGLCQGDCTCPAPVCGNGIIEFLGGEECDGSNDDLCPAGCDEYCQCDFSTPVCCDGLSDASGNLFNGCSNAVPLSTCLSEGTVEEPGGVCDASGTCVASSPAPGDCCAVNGQCYMPTNVLVCGALFEGVFSSYAICSPSGTCESQ